MGASRRNQSPLLTTNSIQEQTSTQTSHYVQHFHNGSLPGRDSIKPSKTRNNLQQHVVSQNPRTKQVVVGQPYINFKKDQADRHLSTKLKHLESLERR